MIIKKQFLLFVTLFLNFLLLAEKIKINNSVLEVVIADTKQSRNQGLMFIDSLDKNMGMFFVWPEPSKKCMWMSIFVRMHVCIYVCSSLLPFLH